MKNNSNDIAMELCPVARRTVLRTKDEIDREVGRKIACFSNGVARGTKEDLILMLDAYDAYNRKISSTEIPGIYEVNLRHFFPYHDGKLYLLDIINRFPSLKIIGFLELGDYVYVAYSESGYDGITDLAKVGNYDPKSENSWQWNYSPTECFSEVFQTVFDNRGIIVIYDFPNEVQWFDRNYFVSKDGKSYRLTLTGENVALPWDSPQLWHLEHSEQEQETAYIAGYLGNQEEVFFPERVGDLFIAGISDRRYASIDCYKNVKIIHIPKTYRIIGKRAFYDCPALERVIFYDGSYPQDNLRRIDDYAFAECKALKSVQLPPLREFGTYYPDDTAPLGTGVFENCSMLQDVWALSSEINACVEDTFKGCDHYTIHGMPQWELAQRNGGHFKPITADECRTLLGERQWPIEVGCSTNANYCDIPIQGEWVVGEKFVESNSAGAEWDAYRQPQECIQLVREDGSRIRCEVYGQIWEFIALFDVKFAGFTFGNSSHCCTLELYPKGIQHTNNVPVKKRMHYNDPKNKQFLNQIFVLDNQVRLEVEDRILERGGEIKASVVQKTDYLVINPCESENTAKRKRAAELLQKGKSALKIITIEEFFAMIQEK